MTIKKVIGYYNGDKNRKVTFIDRFEEGTVWSIDAEDDHYALQLKGSDELYRMCWADQWGKGYKKALSEGGMLAQINKYCDACFELYKGNLAHTISANKAKVTNCNANWFGLAGRMEQLETILANNKAIRDNEEKEREREAAEQESNALENKIKELNEAKELIKVGDTVDGDILIELADEYEIKIPLRTRGWMMNKLVLISSNSMRWRKEKRGSRASQKPYEIYAQVKSAILAESVQ